MSFWEKALDVAKNVGTTVITEIEKSANETREIKQKYEDKNDDELFRIVHSDGFFGESQKEKGIAFSILKNRGYSVEDINSKKR